MDTHCMIMTVMQAQGSVLYSPLSVIPLVVAIHWRPEISLILGISERISDTKVTNNLPFFVAQFLTQSPSGTPVSWLKQALLQSR